MKVALVTGAHKGLGLAWCKLLAKEGYTILLTARNLSDAQNAVSSMAEGTQKILPHALDVADEMQIQKLAEKVKQDFGRLDLLINNAGVNPKDFSDKSKRDEAFYLDALKAETLLEVIRVNSVAPLLMVKHFRALLRESEHPLVLNISSWLGSVTQLSFPGHYGYTGSKNLLNIWNKSMAEELRKDEIISVNVNPGWVSTAMGGKNAPFTPDQAVEQLMEQVVKKVSLAQSGMFLNYDGTIHPW